jgi:hypothetical protein
LVSSEKYWICIDITAQKPYDWNATKIVAFLVPITQIDLAINTLIENHFFMLKPSENKICKHSHVQQAFCMLKSLIYFTYLLGLLICFDSCSHSLQIEMFMSYEEEVSDIHERKSKTNSYHYDHLCWASVVMFPCYKKSAFLAYLNKPVKQSLLQKRPSENI